MTGAMKSRIKWREKMQRPDKPRIVDITPRMQKVYGKGKMIIATPLIIDGLVRKVPKGKLITVKGIMEKLAREFKVNSACPMTTGIFLRIVAEAAEEDLRDGRKQITPYWRVLKEGGKLNEKFPGGVKAQAGRLRKEGHRIATGKGKQAPAVKEFEKKLVKL